MELFLGEILWKARVIAAYWSHENENLSIDPSLDEKEFEIGHSRHGYYFIRIENVRRNLATSASHTLFDGKVGHQVAKLFDYGTRSVSFAGTHRCFSDEFSTCSGTTSVCGNGSEKFRVTDIAHGWSLKLISLKFGLITSNGLK